MSTENPLLLTFAQSAAAAAPPPAINPQAPNFELIASYYSHGERFSFVLPLTPQAQGEFNTVIEEIRQALPQGAQQIESLDFKRFRVNGESISSQCSKRILEIIGKTLAPVVDPQNVDKYAAQYVEQQMPLSGPHSARGDTHPTARKSFLGVTGPMEQLFDLRDRDEIYGLLDQAWKFLQLPPLSQANSWANYFQVWALERFLEAFRTKIREMRNALAGQPSASPQIQEQITHSIKALDDFDRYIQSLNCFRLYFAILTQSLNTPDRIRLIEQIAKEQNRSRIKKLLHIDSKPITITDKISLQDLALLPITDPIEYHRERAALYLSSTVDPLELPLIRWMRDHNTATCFTHPYFKIKDPLQPGELGTLRTFFDDFLTQLTLFEQSLRNNPALTVPHYQNWSQEISAQQMQQKAQHSTLFLSP